MLFIISSSFREPHYSLFVVKAKDTHQELVPRSKAMHLGVLSEVQEQILTHGEDQCHGHRTRKEQVWEGLLLAHVHTPVPTLSSQARSQRTQPCSSALCTEQDVNSALQTEPHEIADPDVFVSITKYLRQLIH